MKICFASNNNHKIRELNQMVWGMYTIVGLKELGVEEDIIETGETFEENSRIKAQYIFDRYSIPVFADDSGLCVDALNGEPGVYSARYAGPEKDVDNNIDLLLANLRGIENRKAKFVSVITLIKESGEEVQFYGEIGGTILEERQGSKGFGYDPIFQPFGYNKTFAEISSEEKNQLSHRAIAVKKFIDHLKSNE
ncbi:MAG: RdgB/HAM1 family non-canonical purine NTP pyrophosphatase [Bacteroidota bacterium]